MAGPDRSGHTTNSVTPPQTGCLNPFKGVFGSTACMTDLELTEIVGTWVFWPLIVGRAVGDPLLDRHGCRRLAVLRHAENMTGKVAITGGVSAQSGFVDEKR